MVIQNNLKYLSVSSSHSLLATIFYSLTLYQIQIHFLAAGVGVGGDKTEINKYKP